jgi:hypothetical protein
MTCLLGKSNIQVVGVFTEKELGPAPWLVCRGHRATTRKERVARSAKRQWVKSRDNMGLRVAVEIIWRMPREGRHGLCLVLASSWQWRQAVPRMG